MPDFSNYVSPILRCAIFRRLYPGAQISYTVVSMDSAFPNGYDPGPGKPEVAILCQIDFADGTQIITAKEVDTFEKNKKTGKYELRALTPEEWQKDETKALGRSMRDAGVPMNVGELQTLMRWIVALEGTGGQPPTINGRAINTQTGEIEVASSASPDDGPDGEVTPEQELASRFSSLDGPMKASITTRAKADLGVSNVMRAGSNAPTIITWLDELEKEDQQ